MIKYFYLAIFLFLGTGVLAQANWPFESEIKNFEKADQLNPPKKSQILFIGSSSIRLWTDLENRFSDYHIIKRGFGGGELADVNHYADRILLPYQPAKVFLYAGENDITAGKTVAETYQLFLKFYEDISTSLPKTKVYFLSIKPSPSRKSYTGKFDQFNANVKEFISTKACNWYYIDVATPLLGSDGLPPVSIFQADKLHMNSTGYDIWEKIIRNYL